MCVEALEGRRMFSGDAAAATGLDAVYYNNANFSGTTVSRVDRAVDFTWKTSPAASIAATNYAVRWTGRIKAPTSETYRIYLVSESNVRLWIDNQLVVDGWKTTASPTVYRGSSALTANKRYDIEVELAH